MVAAIALTAALLSGVASCPEQTAVRLEEVTGERPILEAAELLSDPESQVSLHDVLLPPVCAQFGAAAGRADGNLAAGVRHWLRLRVDPGGLSPDAWILFVRFPAFDRLCVHWPVGDDVYETRCTGFADPAHDRPVTHHRFAFPLPRGLDGRRPAFLEAEAQVRASLEGSWVRADRLLGEEHGDQFFGGVFYGLLLATVAYALTFVMALRDRVSLLYAGHLSCLALALLGFEGRGQELLWWWLGSWGGQLPVVLLSGSFVLGARFGRAFLETGHRLASIDRLLRLATWIAALAIPVAPFSDTSSQRIVAVAALLFVVGVGSGAFLLARRGDRPARYLLIGVSAFLLGTLAMSLDSLGLPLLPPSAAMALTRAGVVIGAFSMALALGQRLRELRRERDRAQVEAAAQQQIALLWASTDELTQLPSRARLLRDATRLLGEVLQASETLIVCVLDVRRFREVHHGFGQDADAVLVQVAHRLRRAFSRETLLARLGSDEFALAARAATDPQAAAHALAQRALDTFDDPFAVGERTVRLEATAGLAWAPTFGRSIAELLRLCDAAIYSARSQDKGPIAVYATDASAAELALRSELWRAIDAGQLLNVYQPQHDLLNAERVGGVETLLRWRHPTRGLLTPSQFLGIAEGSELISQIGEWTLRRACRDLKAWTAAGVAPEKLAVNVSARDFQRSDFSRSVAKVLEEESTSPAQIELELTESLLLADLETARRSIQDFRGMGVRVALDDFGTGYSSLTQIRDLPITGLKVDQSFVAALDRSPEANAILATLVTLAGELDLELTAEGVESAWQRDVLRRYGCHLAQGYYFARPMPAAEMKRYLGGARTGPVETPR